MAEDRLSYAKKYTLLGWPVIPLHWITTKGVCSCGNKNCRSPGKHPRLKHGPKDATTDEKQIESWFRQTPFANIGIVTGETSGLFVLDIDPKNGGLESLERLIEQHGPMPDEVMQITGSGGRHYVFKYPGDIGRSTTNLWPGIDTRGTGGYIVVAPSNHISGNEYFWDAEADPLEGAKPSDCPRWLLDKLAEKSSVAAVPEVKAAAIEKAEVRRIKAALSYIPADDRDIWLKVGMALHSTQAEDQAFGIWCEWAMQSDKFDMADSRRVWSSFKPNGVGLGSLFASAKARGWMPQESRPPDPPVTAYADDLKKDSQTKPRKKRPRKDGGAVDHELSGDILKRYVFLKNHNRIYDRITRNELTRDGFDGAYLHKFNDTKPSTFFLRNSETIKADGLIYLPGMTENPVRRNGALLWNIWTDPKVSLPDQASDDDIALWLEHLAYLYPNPDEQKHLLDWFACTLQHPATKINHALLIAGTSRVGKDTLLNPLRYGLGERNVCEPPATELKENFTDYLHHAKLVIFQEIQTFEGLNLENKLKPMLAAPPDSLRVRLFGRGFYETPNIVQAIFMSNYRDALHISEGDGRYYAVWTDVKPLSREYYTELFNWLDQGGNGLVVRWLLNRDLSQFNPKDSAPTTQFKNELILTSKSPLKHHIISMIKGFDYPFTVDVVRSTDIHKSLRDKYSVKAISSVLTEIGCLQRECRRGTGRREWFGFFAVRNIDYWKDAQAAEWIDAYEKRHAKSEDYANG